MIKTILIPTDFKIESLNTLKYALQDNTIFDIEVILLHSEILGDSITDLLFYSSEAIIKNLLTPSFEEALAILKNRYKEIKSVHIEVTHGNNRVTMTQLLKARKVDEVFIPETYKLQLYKRAFDPLPMLCKSGFPVYEVNWKSRTLSHEKDQLDELFKS